MQYGLIGANVTQSFSKYIHEFLQSYNYELLSLNKSQFNEFMLNKDFTAINITIPYKIAALKYVDVLDPLAKRIGSINTIVNIGGVLHGYNSDYAGFATMLDLANIDVSNKKVILIGNGGAAQCIKTYLADNNALSTIIVTANIHDDTITASVAYQEHADAQIIINSSPCGMYPDDEQFPLDINRFPNLIGVGDIIYHPLRTRLGLHALKHNIKYAQGLDMLIAQAIKAIQYFNGSKCDESAFTNTYALLMNQMENIVLIGMPTSGKSLIGEMLAKKHHKQFIDIDQMIESETTLSIADIFKNFGEAHFRLLEQKCISKIASYNNCVIATGGGAIIDESNIDALKRNGYIVWIKRDINLLFIDIKRPLSNSKKAIEQLSKEREPLYLAHADYVCENNSVIENAVDTIYTNFTNTHNRRI